MGKTLSSFFHPTFIDVCGSTNNELKQAAAKGAPVGSLIVANQQIAGRGRGDHQWISPPGNLYFSVLLRPDVPIVRYSQMSFVAALAIARTVQAQLPNKRVRIKWPNDILVENKKISGILIESGHGPKPDQPYMILGIGLNITNFPTANVRVAATSLFEEGAAQATRDQVLIDLSNQLEVQIQLWLAEGFEMVRAAWLKSAQGSGDEIEVRIAGLEPISGTFEDLDNNGALVLRLKDGTTKLIHAGDVSLPGIG